MTGPTMGNAERRAIVWDAIERKAFRPISDNEKLTWLSLYALSLARLWGIQKSDLQIRYRKGGFLESFAIPCLALDCRCSIEGPDKYDVSLFRPADSSPVVFWHLHVDPNFPSRRGCCGPSEEYPRQDMTKCLEADIETVLDGMLFHPRNHAHAEDLGIQCPEGQPSMFLPTHEVRLGGGIENAFVFLAHLRYQFCLLSEELREQERRRLNDLFREAILENTSIVPKDLFNP